MVGVIMLNVTYMPFMLSVIMLNGVMMSVVALTNCGLYYKILFTIVNYDRNDTTIIWPVL
jgi:hypothetical protein